MELPVASISRTMTLTGIWLWKPHKLAIQAMLLSPPANAESLGQPADAGVFIGIAAAARGAARHANLPSSHCHNKI